MTRCARSRCPARRSVARRLEPDEPVETVTVDDLAIGCARGHQIRFQSAARRAVAQRLPEAVAAAVLEFCEATLAVNPQRVGKPLFGPLADCHGALRGTYRIEENTHAVHVLDIDHRAEIYRPHS